MGGGEKVKLFIDCEFNEFKGELISMALVAENGKEWYEVLPCDNPKPWVERNVIPVLDKEPIPFREFQKSLYRFLKLFDRIHVIADWPEDVKHFCETLIISPGMRIDTPPLSFEIVREDFPSERPHNALADARGIMTYYKAKEVV